MTSIARLLTSFLSAALAAGAFGQVPEAEEGGAAVEVPADAAEQEPAAAEPPQEQRCRLPAGGNWLDWLQRNVYRSVCLTGLWFDDFFGDERIGSEREGTWGRVSGGLIWDERDDIDGAFRLRAKLALPRMEHRLHAIIGRDAPDRLGEGELAPADGIPEAFRDGDDEWLTGLEYEPVRGDRHDLDFGLGVRIESLDPYAKLRYRFQEPLAPKWFLRTRVTPFWRESTRFGLGSRVDLDRSLGPGLLLRLGAAATITDISEGVEWQAGPGLYQRLGEGRALAYRLVFEGATDPAEPSSVVSLGLHFRQRLLREWLTLELEPRLEWRHPSPEEPREAIPGFGVGLEMRFGER